MDAHPNPLPNPAIRFLSVIGRAAEESLQNGSVGADRLEDALRLAAEYRRVESLPSRSIDDWMGLWTIYEDQAKRGLWRPTRTREGKV